MLSLRAALNSLRTIVSALAPLTASPFDDRLVEGIDAFLANDDFLTFLEGLLESGDSLQLVAPPAALVQELEKRKIDWARFVEFLPTLITLIRAFSGK